MKQRIAAIFLIGFISFYSIDSLNAETFTYHRCAPELKVSAPNGRFVDNGDGTVSDLITGLMWKKCTEGLSGNDCSIGLPSKHNWQVALQLPETLNASGGFAGHDDWRLPNIKELASLRESSCEKPAMNINFFPAHDYLREVNFRFGEIYWSSTPSGRGNSDYERTWVWDPEFGTHNIYTRDSEVNIRLVRNQFLRGQQRVDQGDLTYLV